MQRVIGVIIAVGTVATADGLDSVGWARGRRNHAGQDGPESINMTIFATATEDTARWDAWEWATAVPPCAVSEVNLQLPDGATDSRYSNPRVTQQP